MSNTAEEVLDDLLSGDRGVYVENPSERHIVRGSGALRPGAHFGWVTTRIQHRSGEVFEVKVTRL